MVEVLVLVLQYTPTVGEVYEGGSGLLCLALHRRLLDSIEPSRDGSGGDGVQRGKKGTGRPIHEVSYGQALGSGGLGR